MMKVAVIGAGSMGAGIAQVAATAGHEVYLIDTKKEAITKALEKIQYYINRSATKGRISDSEAVAIFGRIYGVESIDSISDAGLVIEAIIEDLDIKQSLFQKIESIVSEKCIIASNTSSLSISALAAGFEKKDRFLGLHFFNPATLMKLVEVVPGLETDDIIRDNCTQLMESWGKMPVTTKDTPGFIVNRVARPFYSEALRICEEGIANPATIDHAMKNLGGFRMGPFELMDYIGHDVNFKVTNSVWKAFYHEPRYKPSFTQKNLVAAGRLGKKSGRGFYDYASDTPPADQMVIDNDKLENVFNRVLYMLINEAYDAAFWNIATPNDIDTAMQFGVNYPKGLISWGKEIGLQKVADRLAELYGFYQEERYRTSPGIKKSL